MKTDKKVFCMGVRVGGSICRSREFRQMSRTLPERLKSESSKKHLAFGEIFGDAWGPFVWRMPLGVALFSKR
jgi:hypothetical protein